MSSLTVFTHGRPEQTAGALERVIELAREAGWDVRLPGPVVEKHGIRAQDGVELGADPAGETDLAADILADFRRAQAHEAPPPGQEVKIKRVV